MPLHELTDPQLPTDELHRRRRVEGVVDGQVPHVVPLKLRAVVPLLLADQAVTQVGPGNEVHPLRVHDGELGWPGPLPLVETLVGCVGARGLPLHEAVHGDETGQALREEREPAPREHGVVALHDPSELGRHGARGNLLVVRVGDEGLHGGQGGAEERLRGGDGERLEMGFDDAHHEPVDLCHRYAELGGALPGSGGR